jgi:hypothetical protein
MAEKGDESSGQEPKPREQFAQKLRNGHVQLGDSFLRRDREKI